jgi:hypothetical protein
MGSFVDVLYSKLPWYSIAQDWTQTLYKTQISKSILNSQTSIIHTLNYLKFWS